MRFSLAHALLCEVVNSNSKFFTCADFSGLSMISISQLRDDTKTILSAPCDVWDCFGMMQEASSMIGTDAFVMGVTLVFLDLSHERRYVALTY
jgi:hypothetical protein